MGMRHRQRVYEVPPGYLTPDERLVLLVLADETPDFHEDKVTPRLEWVHRRDELMPLLGLDFDREADHKWLSRRLKALDDAGFITRRKQRRGDAGQWHLPSIKLELSAFDFDVFDGIIVKPTKRASHDDPRAKNLDGHRPAIRDAKGRFTRQPVDTPDGPVKDTPDGPVKDTPDGDRWTLPREPHRTTQDIEQDLEQDSRPLLAVEDAFQDPDFNLEDRKREANAALAALTEQWTMEGESS